MEGINISIENINGRWLVNGKRLGRDELTPFEISALNEFIREYKQLENELI